MHSIQMRGFESGTSSLQADTVVPTTTYLLARDEDCENSFHSTADFVSIFLPFCFIRNDSLRELAILAPACEALTTI